MARAFVAVVLLVASSGASACSVLGPSCLARQKTGIVTTAGGRAEAGQVVTHLLPYDLQGSQNDVHISWIGQGQIDGPRLRFYATSVACVDFVPPIGSAQPTGACAPIASAGGYLAPWARECARNGSCPPTPDEIVNTSIIVTGPGNGAPPDFREYKVHVVGDPERAASYSINVTWFFGPDC